jgi:predicted ATPase
VNEAFRSRPVRAGPASGAGFPFEVPAVAAVEDLRLDRPVTMLAGGNGSGKSTISRGRRGGDRLRGRKAASSTVWADCRRCSALAPLAVIARAAGDGAQFVIATHSPILLACPHARVYELDGDGVATPDYDELQAVRLTRGFLAAPERYPRALDAESREDDEDP